MQFLPLCLAFIFLLQIFGFLVDYEHFELKLQIVWQSITFYLYCICWPLKEVIFNISISILNSTFSSLNTFKQSSRLSGRVLNFASSVVFAQLFNISKSIFNSRFDNLSWILLIFAQDCLADYYILPFLCFIFSIS